MRAAVAPGPAGRRFQWGLLVRVLEALSPRALQNSFSLILTLEAKLPAFFFFSYPKNSQLFFDRRNIKEGEKSL